MPVGPIGQFADAYADEFKRWWIDPMSRAWNTTVNVAASVPSMIQGGASDLLGNLPGDAGLITSQVVADPFEFSSRFADEYPKEVERVWGSDGVFAPLKMLWAQGKWAALAVIGVAVIMVLWTISPAVRGVLGKVTKAV